VLSFKKDLAACRDIVRHRPDPSQEPKIDFETPERVLEIAPYAGTPEAGYIKANSDYVVLWVTYHRDPFAVSRLLESEPLFCSLSTKRMEDMDSSAAPEEGWEIREHFLNIGITNLESALDIGSGDGFVPWGWLQSQLELAEQLYIKTHREKLLEISVKTASQIEQLVAHDDSAFKKIYGDQKSSADVLKARADLDKEIADRKRFIQAMIERLKKT